EEAQVEESHRAGQDTLALQPSLAEVMLGQQAHLGQDAPEAQHLVELLLRAALEPAVVVAVLAPAGVVGADGLQVTEGIGADPDVGPRRRHGQHCDPLERLLVLDALARALVPVFEAAAPHATPDARPRAVGSSQPAHAYRRRCGWLTPRIFDGDPS